MGDEQHISKASIIYADEAGHAELMALCRDDRTLWFKIDARFDGTNWRREYEICRKPAP